MQMFYKKEETNPEIFNFIVDVYWLQVGGVTPQDFIEKLGKRAMAIHFKDFAVNINDWQTPLMTHIGSGNLDRDKIIPSCEKVGSRWALVEQHTNWINNNPFDALSISYNFLKQKGFC